MENIWNLGISIILFIQSLGEWLMDPMQIASFMGSELFFLFVAPAIIWCLDFTLGLRLGLFLMISASINSILKLLFHGPRPYWYDSSVKAYSTETSFGLPSGHSQNAVVVWGTLAAWINRTWAWVVAIALIFLIGFSRMYLGVHFPSDVLMGLLAGAIILWILLRYEDRAAKWLGGHKISDQILIILGISLVMILLGALARLALNGWSLPASWVDLAARAAPDAETIDPLSISGLVSNGGAFFGMAVGGILIKARGGFDAGGQAWKRAVRFLIGVVGVFLIWSGLSAVFPGGETLLSYGLRYLRYSLVGLWITALGPFLFIRLRLAESKERANGG